MPYVICVIDTNHDQLLSHFLRHYRQLGVSRFVFGVRRGKDNPAWAYIAELNAPDIEVRETTPPPNAINGEVDSVFINSVKDEFGGWYIPADLDEFHVIDESSFTVAQQLCLAQNANFVLAKLVDRVAQTGEILPQISLAHSIYEQFPKEVDITKNVMRGAGTKVCFASAAVSVGPGHHLPLQNRGSPVAAKLSAKTMHFKWFGDVLTREQLKYDVRKSVNSPWAKEQNLLFDYLRQNNSKLVP